MKHKTFLLPLGFILILVFGISACRSQISDSIPTPTPTLARSPTGSNNFKNSIGMEFVSIPNGSFMMGSSDAEIDEALYEAKKYFNDAKREMFTNETPKHKVIISNDFYMGKYEVTQEEYEKVIGTNPSKFKNCPRCPVEMVSWDDAQDFVKKLNAKNEGTYRLPTEAEWEYAARAGTTGNYAGNLDAMAWYYNNAGNQILSGKWSMDKLKSNNNRTHEVGAKQPNDFGLYDMHGNVWEWCEDWYGSYPSVSVTDPTGANSGSERVIRGGGWGSPAVLLRSALRDLDAPSASDHYGNRGFRLLRE